MIRLVCVSTTERLLSQDALLDILRTNAQNHEHDQITGLLVYHNGDFMQVLEGPEDLVGEVMARATAASEKGDVNVLLREEIEERYFDRWTMSFATTRDLAPEDQKHLSDFLERGELPEPGDSASMGFYQVLKAFRSEMKAQKGTSQERS